MDEEINVIHWQIYKFPKLKDFTNIVNQALEILKNEPNIAYIASPVTVIGDLHGHFKDLLFFLKNKTENSKFVFLGDYVDRGNQSLDILFFLLNIKVKYPNNIVLLRGNHEFKSINLNYGFKTECKHKYPNTNIWELCNKLFETLPIACIIDEKYFCIHGGVTPEILLNDILKYNRFTHDWEATFSDLLWSDPCNDLGLQFNTTRGCGKFYGPDITKKFLQKNNLEKIIRAHECEPFGYKWWHDDRVLTIFSASNYTGNNSAAVLKILDDGSLHVESHH